MLNVTEIKKHPFSQTGAFNQLTSIAILSKPKRQIKTGDIALHYICGLKLLISEQVSGTTGL